MKLEQQVCSLELAKRLKELGVKQESLFWWLHAENGDVVVYNVVPSMEKDVCCAFTVAELGEMLPKIYITWRDTLVGDEWWLCDDRRKSSTDTYQYAKTEADARAKMLVYLLENKLVESAHA